MTLEELSKKLQTTGLPVDYLAPPHIKEQPLPRIYYVCDDSNTLYADGIAYYTYANVEVGLYTAIKSPETETLVETALTGFHWKKSETYISTERCYLITYEIEV